MAKATDNYCIILAGGKGRRLWPSSRERFPKQFVDFFGCGKTQLQQTYDRFANIVPRENIFVSTNVEYADIVAEQLPNLPQANLMAEPIHRNTAPAAAWTTHRVVHKNPRANVVITPSDQIVQDERAFSDRICLGLDFVSSTNRILTIGVKPTRPEPGYGYIQTGERIGSNIFTVKSFTEKPEREFAQMFIDSGEFLWNTGLFLANARFLYESFCRMLPSVLRQFDDENPNFTVDEENAFIRDNFPLYPHLSLDYGILEHTNNVAVMRCDFGWADLGTWHSIYEVMCKGEGDNVIVDSEVLLDNAHGNVVKIEKGRIAVISGLEGFIVAEKGNVLFICKKGDSSLLVKKLSSELQMTKGDDYV